MIDKIVELVFDTSSKLLVIESLKLNILLPGENKLVSSLLLYNIDTSESVNTLFLHTLKYLIFPFQYPLGGSIP